MTGRLFITSVLINEVEVQVEKTEEPGVLVEYNSSYIQLKDSVMYKKRPSPKSFLFNSLNGKILCI